MTNKEKFLALVKKHDVSVLKDAKWRIANREMLRESQDIALKILARLDELKMSKNDFAIALKVKPQQVTKFVSGKANFEIKTLTKIQRILDIPLLASYYENNKIKSESLFSSMKQTIEKVHAKQLPTYTVNMKKAVEFSMNYDKISQEYITKRIAS